jgi:2-hydroxy-4-carboxymuconate semialdehyde hemiacetal dehydrogenase
LVLDSALHYWQKNATPWTACASARYDDLVIGKQERIDVSKVVLSMNGIELQDREFFAPIKKGREPNSSVAKVFNCHLVLQKLEHQLNG